MSDLGEFIRDERKKAGLSMQELAAACNVSNTAICNLEHGKIKNPKAEYLRRISKVLNVDEMEFLSRAGYSKPHDSSKSEHPLSTIRVAGTLGEKELQEVQTFVDFLLYKKNSESGERRN